MNAQFPSPILILLMNYTQNRTVLRVFIAEHTRIQRARELLAPPPYRTPAPPKIITALSSRVDGAP